MFSFWKGTSADGQTVTTATPASEGALIDDSQNNTNSNPPAGSSNNVNPSSPIKEEHPSTKVGASNSGPSGAVDASNGSIIPFPRPSTSTEVYVSQIQTVPGHSPPVDITGAALAVEPPRKRRISFRSFGFFYGRQNSRAPEDVEEAPTSPIGEPKDTPPKHKLKSKKDERKVEKSALVLRSFLLGYTPSFPLSIPRRSAQHSNKGKDANPQLKPFSQEKLLKANNQLLTPDKASKVIAKLRTLPPPDGPELPGIEYAGEHVISRAEGPIHAVCLDCTEEEADKYHFSRLTSGAESSLSNIPARNVGVTTKFDTPSIASANLSSLVPVLRDLRIVTLVSSPDLGFGQPPDGNGPLAGAVPSAGVISNGMMEITTQLLSLGFATSKAIYPDHVGVYPPIDRMSVLTYWWGMEVCMPPPTLQYLANVKSIQNSALNLLTAISLFNNGVREILPFVRYISQFLDFQWGAITGQNKGKGVVCAATWVCPAALVPRPWDFPDPPAGQNIVIPKAEPPSQGTGPTLVFPGSGANLFTPNAPSLPPVMITPATLPRGAKFDLLKT